jgi:NAD(P)-dependent dehydrogenase (short-subunit alcohol dehydrogenase family)
MNGVFVKNIVITGSSRGIGYGLASAFLARGCRVMVSGRSQDSVDRAVVLLSAQYSAEQIQGCCCDVSRPEQVQGLWNRAFNTFGGVDIWINNAGVNHPVKALWDLPAQTLQSVISTNLLGLAYGSQVAVKGMLAQGYGHLYNMEGHGSGGQILQGMTGYGTSKSGVRYLTKALIQETRHTVVKVSTLSPGMVVTGLVADQYRDDPAGLERIKVIFNLFGDSVDTVAPWLAHRVLENDRSGATIVWFTWTKMLWRLATAYQPRDLFQLEGASEVYAGEFG